MILAAGLGTRLRPLTELRAKPALPIRGRAVISILLDFLSRHGVNEVMINLHYLPETIRNAVELDCPQATKITWSIESEPLGTGGGIRKAANFLKRDEHCVVLAGDMLLDLDLTASMQAHAASGRDATLLLRDDPRGTEFGTIGLDIGGRVTRIGGDEYADAQSEVQAGIFTGVRFFSRSVFRNWPTDAAGDRTVFEDLRDWLMPAAESGAMRIGGDRLTTEDSVWEPVGTLSEYLAANLEPPMLPTLGGEAEQWEGELDTAHAPDQNGRIVIGAGASLGPDCVLSEAVVWSGETIPAGLRASRGVFAGGQFHAVQRARSPESAP